MTVLNPNFYAERYEATRRRLAYTCFHRMIVRQRVALDKLSGREATALVEGALDACTRCAKRPACANWFDGNAPAQDYRRFCQNSAAIEALRIMAG